MAKKKRITRKSMKQPDEFISMSTRAIDFLMVDHQREFIIVSSILVGLLVLYFALDLGRGFYRDNAYAAYFEALDTFRNPADTVGEEGETVFKVDNQKAVEQFQQVIDDYGFSSAAELSLFYLGLANYKLGKIDQAVLSLESYAKEMEGKTAYEVQGLFALARIYEAENDKSNALEVYERLAKYPPSPYETVIEERKKALAAQMGRSGDFFGGAPGAGAASPHGAGMPSLGGGDGASPHGGAGMPAMGGEQGGDRLPAGHP